MSKVLNQDQLEIEMLAERDVRKFIEMLQEHYDSMKDAGEISNKEISLRTGMDSSLISRIINGRTDNPNIKTITRLFRALNLRLEPSICLLKDVIRETPNADIASDFREVKWRYVNNYIAVTSSKSIQDKSVRFTSSPKVFGERPIEFHLQNN